MDDRKLNNRLGNMCKYCPILQELKTIHSFLDRKILEKERMSVTEIHKLTETIKVEVFVPEHEPRKTTSIFSHTRLQLIERENGKCWLCGKTAEPGRPLEAHHHPIERSFANMIDWKLFQADCEKGIWGPHAQSFNWISFDPENPYTFVDDMTVNGVLLCKEDHVVSNSGIHTLPFPIWIVQKYGLEGYKFSDKEIIHHNYSEEE